MSIISKIYLTIAAMDVVTGCVRVSQHRYVGAVLDFVLTSFWLWMAYEYRNLEL